MKAPNPDTLKQVKDFSRPAITFAIARAEGSEVAYLGGSDFKVYQADFAAKKFEPKELYAHESYVTGVALAGTTLVSGSYDGKLTWFDTTENKPLRTHDAHAKWIRKVIASPDGKWVASVADDMVCKLWDVKTGQVVHTLKGHKEKTPNDFTSMLYAVAFSADGALVATGDKVGHVVVWDVKTGKQLGTCEAPVMYTWDKVQRLHSIGGIRSLAFSPDGKLLAVGGMGKVGNIDHLEGKARVEVFDWKTGKQAAEFPGDKFSGLVNRLAWAPDGSWLVGAGGAGEGFLCFYDVAAKKTLRQEKVPMHVHDFVISAAGDLITSAGHYRITIHRLG
ncbi:MAG TPA: PQQ-binding-like beta-propeller repeat protein [Gemmata sp.]